LGTKNLEVGQNCGENDGTYVLNFSQGIIQDFEFGGVEV
jgi:hypothetical protein